MNKTLTRAKYLAATSCLLLSGTAYSATLPTDMADKEAASSQEIVVTADRRNSFGADFVQAGNFRDARVLDTPLTVSILPKELLNSQLARSVVDAVRNTAGVTQAQIGSTIYSNLAIRGIAVGNVTNYRLNGILPIMNFIDMPIEDKDRVEVLKGAAGLYYGFAAPSGVVNLVSKRPTADPITSVEVTANSHGAVVGGADVSRTFGDVGVRLNGAAGSVESGLTRSSGHRFFVSGAIDWKATDRLTFQLDSEYIFKTVTEPTVFSLPAAVNGVITLPPLQPPSRSIGSEWMQARSWEFNVLGRARYEVSSDWSVSLSAGESYANADRHFSSFSGYNLTTGNGTLGLAVTNDAVYKSVIYRGDIAGKFSTGPIEHNILIGLSENLRDTITPAAVRTSYAQNLYNPVDIPAVAMLPRVISSRSHVRDIGAFIFDRATYNEWLQVTVGYRKSDYSEVTTTTSYKVKPGTWSYGGMIKPVKWASLYGNYIEGLESSGIVPQIASNAGQTLPATLSKQTEFGAKVEPIHGLLFTGAYFDISRASSYLNSANLYVMDGQAKYQGVELSVVGEIVPALSISASGAMLTAKQESGAPAVIGKRIENTAKYSGSIFAEYKVPLVSGLRVSAGMFYVGRRAVNALNQAFVPGYTTFDVGGSYLTEIGGHSITFRVYGSNITGKRYWAGTGSSLLAEGTPATVRFSLTGAF